MISTITAAQKFSSLHPLIRVNATELYVYRLRNYKDLVANKKTLMELYNLATSEPYSFSYLKLTAKTKMICFCRFDKKLIIED